MRRFTEFPAMPGADGPAQPGANVREAVQAMGQLLKDIQAQGKAPSTRILEVAQTIGFVLLLGLLIYANGNDILRALQ